MDSQLCSSTRYAAFRRGGQLLGRLAIVAQLGCVLLGVYLFLGQAKDLISDAQFTWGERRVMAVIAAVTLGGCSLAGWTFAQVFRLTAGILDVLADGAESAARTNELIERQLIPSLGRIASILEDTSRAPLESQARSPSASGPAALQAELRAAQAAGRVNRVIDLRDALTRHLRGDPLHELDRDLAVWLLNLVERRVQAGTVDGDVAAWVARALDSFGAMREADPLRQALPALRRHTGLCVRCGQILPAAGKNHEGICPICRRELAATSTGKSHPSRKLSAREEP